MAGNIFVSYRRDDSKHAAGRLVDRLEDVFGDGQLFLDVDNIELGLDFVQVINERVAACDIMLVVIGPQWLAASNGDGKLRLQDPNDFVRIEVEAALERNIRVIPVLVDGAEPPRADELPASLAPLAKRQAIRLEHESFISDANALTAALMQIVGKSSDREALNGRNRVAEAPFAHRAETTGGAFQEDATVHRFGANLPPASAATRETAAEMAGPYPGVTSPTRPGFDILGWLIAVSPPLILFIELALLDAGTLAWTDLHVFMSLSQDQNAMVLPIAGGLVLLGLHLVRQRRASILLKIATGLVFAGSIVFFLALA